MFSIFIILGDFKNCFFVIVEVYLSLDEEICLGNFIEFLSNESKMVEDVGSKEIVIKIFKSLKSNKLSDIVI